MGRIAQASRTLLRGHYAHQPHASCTLSRVVSKKSVKAGSSTRFHPCRELKQIFTLMVLSLFFANVAMCASDKFQPNVKCLITSGKFKGKYKYHYDEAKKRSCYKKKLMKSTSAKLRIVWKDASYHIVKVMLSEDDSTDSEEYCETNNSEK